MARKSQDSDKYDKHLWQNILSRPKNERDNFPVHFHLDSGPDRDSSPCPSTEYKSGDQS
jgi:hypothetical protein